MIKIKKFWQIFSIVLLGVIFYLIFLLLSKVENEEMITDQYILLNTELVMERNKLIEQNISSDGMDNIIFNNILWISLVDAKFSGKNSNQLLNSLVCQAKRSHELKSFNGNSYANSIGRGEELLIDFEKYLNSKCLL